MAIRRVSVVVGLLLALVPLTAAQAGSPGIQQAAAAPGSSHLLRLNRLTIDTSKPIPAVPAGLAASPSPTSWVVQLRGPSTDDQTAALQAVGLRIVAHGYVPDNGWLVRGQSAAADRARQLDVVQSVIPFQPAYRISPRLDHVVGATEVRVLLFDDVDLTQWAPKIIGLGATEVGRIDESDVKLLHLKLDAAVIPKLARLDAVEWIEPVLPLKLFNDHAADTMGVRPVWAGVPGAPAGIDGTGEVVAVADTGLDTGNPATIHPDFKTHIKQLQAWGRPGTNGDLLANGADPSDNDGHGTHTAGSVVADGSAWAAEMTPANQALCTASCDPSKAPKGLAPKAQLVFQSISGPAPDNALIGVPEDPGVMYGAAYAQGARIHSNSYGSSSAGAYDSQAFLLDRFLETHPDMLITFSAGNDGTDANKDNEIDPGSIGSPATAKDTLAVGASEDDRGANFTSGDAGEAITGVPNGTPLYSTYAVFYVPPAGPVIESDHMSNNSEGMVAFSSRGPTADGRIKPDVVGIGTHVLSTRSSKIPDADLEFGSHYWSRASHGSSSGSPAAPDYPAALDPSYAFDGGTSMSNPLAAGAATDVRQYLRQVQGFADPSAALLKAALTAGAHELQGQYPATPDVTARPDINEGWGRVDVQSSIAPTDGTKIRFIDDPIGLQTGAVASYPIQVTDTSVPLRIQLAWSDVAANLAAAKTLVNDLDLVLTAPDGSVYHGNQFDARSGAITGSTKNATAFDNVNNVEGITIPPSALATGRWRLDVRGANVPLEPQQYALVMRGGLGSTTSAVMHTDGLFYRSNGRPVKITVNDPTAFAANKATVTTHVSTTSDPTGVDVSLAKSTTIPDVYVGQIGIGAPGSPPSSSSLPGTDGDTITVTYPGVSAVTGKVDNLPPTISQVAVGSVTPFGAAVKSHSSELTNGQVDLFTDKSDTVALSATDPSIAVDHTVPITGLTDNKRYYFRASGVDLAGNQGSDDNGGKRYTLRTKQATLEYAYDAEAEDGWTHQTNSNNSAATGADEWHLSSRPEVVHGGAHAWFFGDEDPNKTYSQAADAFLDSPSITRKADAWAGLTFWANYDTEKGFDGLTVLATDDGGSTYRQVPLVSVGPPTGPGLASAEIDGNSGGYRLLSFDLSSFTGATLQLRLEFTSDGGVEKKGFAVDDLTVTGSKTGGVTGDLTSAGGPPSSNSAGSVAALGTVTLTPRQDWMRLEHVEVTRTGSATNLDAPNARLTLPGGGTLTAPFVNGTAVFDNLQLDAGDTAPLALGVGVELAPAARNGRTVAVTVDGAKAVADAPDVVAGSASLPEVAVGVASGSPVNSTQGYRMVASDGGIFTFGTASFLGSTGAIALNKPIVGMAPTPSGQGYWLVASDGGIFTFGDAAFFGSTGAMKLNKPIVGMASTPGGQGYWLVASDGGIFTFGDAAFFGSTGAIALNKPIVGMASTPGGQGYWLVASDGGIFTFGDAAFFGSTGAIALNKPIVGMSSTPSGQGYWLVATDGGIFAFGDAPFLGSTGAIALNKPIVGMSTTPSGRGYWLVASDGGIFTFGDATFLGSTGSIALNKPIVGMGST